ncbi:MAG: PEP-CTERM sorting domain-containing protein [Actinomycetota bacterium]
MKNNFVTSLTAALAVVGVATITAFTATPASAFTFGNITGGDTVGDAYKNDFSFDVSQNGANSVLFKIGFSNTVASSPSGMFIGTVYFDVAKTLLTGVNSVNVGNVGNVNFTGGASTANMPQGNIIGFSTDYAFDNVNGAGNKWAIQSGESLGISFAGKYADVISAINAGSLKLGLHVQNINGGSDTFVSETPGGGTPPESVPEPLTMTGLALGLGGMMAARRRQANKTA